MLAFRAHVCLHNDEPLWSCESPSMPMIFGLERSVDQLMSLRGLTAKGESKAVNHVVIRDCSVGYSEIVGAGDPGAVRAAIAR